MNPLVGEVTDADQLSTAAVPVIVTKAQCPTGAGTLVLPKSAIATSKY